MYLRLTNLFDCENYPFRVIFFILLAYMLFPMKVNACSGGEWGSGSSCSSSLSEAIGAKCLSNPDFYSGKYSIESVSWNNSLGGISSSVLYYCQYKAFNAWPSDPVFGHTVYMSISKNGPTCSGGKSYDPYKNACVDRTIVDSNNGTTLTTIINAEKTAGGKTCPLVGNPIYPGSGNKFQKESDYVGNSAYPLVVERYYNSLLPSGQDFSKHWRHYYQRSIERGNINNQLVVVAKRHTGQTLQFTQQSGLWVPESDVSYQLEETTSINSSYPDGWKLTTPNNKVEHYDFLGRLISISNQEGLTHTVSYLKDIYIDTVTDDFGNTLKFTHTGNNEEYARVYSVRLPGYSSAPTENEIFYQYNTNGYLNKVIYPDEQGASEKTYHYEKTGSPHLLTGITDENGDRFATWDYDTEGRGILSKHGTNAEQVTLVYNTDGSVDVTDSLSQTRNYVFNTVENASKITSITGGTCTSCGSTTSATTYDSNGFIASKTDFNNNQSLYEHNNKGLETCRLEGINTNANKHAPVAIKTEWHATLRKPEIIRVYAPQSGDNLNHTSCSNAVADWQLLQTTDYVYYNTSDFKNGLLHKRIEIDNITSDQRTIIYDYDPNSKQVASINGPRTDISDITSFTYDATTGNLTKITNAKNQETIFSNHDGNGRPQTITDPNGLITTLTYHPRGWLTSRTVDGHTTTFDYDNVGQLEKLTLPTNAFISYDYDAAHRLTDITDNLGNTIHYTLDPMGNRTKEETRDPNGALTRLAEREFNQLNQLLLMISGEGNITRYAYDHNGNQTAMTDPRNTGTNRNTAKTLNPLQTDNTSQSLYDALNRLVEVVHLQSANNSNDDVITTYEYNALDQLTKVIDPNGLETTYTYNALGDLEQLNSPDTGTTTYTYDNAGNRKTQTDAKNITTTYTYDALNRLTSISYPDSSLNVTYTYDENNNGQNGIGRLTTMTDASGTTKYFYDKRGNITDKVITTNNLVSTFQYAYNGADQLIQIIYPSGRQIDYDYDAAGRIDQVTMTEDGTPTILAENLGYEPFGPLNTMDYGNGLLLDRQYDHDYRLSNNIQGSIVNTSYQYDAASNIKDITNNLQSSKNQSFSYDGLSRLTNAQGIYGTQTYDYDATGNRTLITHGATSQTYNYPTNSHHLDNIDNADYFSYDANGNTTDLPHLGLSSLTYNDRNRLNDVSGVNYTYNGTGERVKKDSGTITYYDYGLNGELLAERDGNNTIINEYIYLNGQLLATTTPSTGGTTHDIRSSDWQVAAMGDFDGDGIADIFWRNSTNGQNHLYLMENGHTIKTEGLLNTVGLAWKIVGVGDMNGDGRDDILWRSSNTGANHVYLMNGLTLNQNQNLWVNTVTDQNWQVAGLGDFNGDGKADIFWRHANTNQNWIYLMNGNQISQSQSLNTAGTGWTVKGFGDFNGDNKDDVLWRHSTTGQLWMYQLNGIGIQAQQSIAGTTDLNWKIAGVNDLGGDGKADIVWRHSATGQNWLYQMNGFTIAQSQPINTVTDQNWQIAGTSDFNNDNKADILWRHSQTGKSNTYTMNGKNVTQSAYVWRDSYIEGHRYYVHNDHLGTPQAITDNTQTKVWDADYDPFGEALINTQTITNNIRFPGQYYDSETGLHYNYFRDYDPNTGRYITSDPIGLRGGINTYGYALQNPVVYIDPDGLVAGVAIKLLGKATGNETGGVIAGGVTDVAIGSAIELGVVDNTAMRVDPRINTGLTLLEASSGISAASLGNAVVGSVTTATGGAAGLIVIGGGLVLGGSFLGASAINDLLEQNLGVSAGDLGVLIYDLTHDECL